jgi:hypothetical protein
MPRGSALDDLDEGKINFSFNANKNTKTRV